MLLLLRKMKHSYFDNNEFRKYLLYALGEMALVIIGILIALQIDNWNTDKQDRATLSSYLHSISRNIDSDLASVNQLRAEREAVNELVIRWSYFPRQGDSYTVSEVTLASDVLIEASTLRHFNASSSGYEALKSSGVLDRMQGTDIEKILYDYYDTVARIARKEQDHNDLSRLLSLQMLALWPDGIDLWELSSAWALTAERFESLQPRYLQLMGDSTTQRLTEHLISVGPILLEYDNLDLLGRAFQRLVEVDSMTLDDTAAELLDGIYSRRNGAGQPHVIVDGRVYWQSFSLGTSHANDPRVSYDASAAGLLSPFGPDSFRRIGDSLHIDYHGGAAWAGIWFFAGFDGARSKTSTDYSMYTALLLELKGDTGGEKIVVNIEDRDDPADGSSTRYELQLSDQWETYKIDLAEFKTADLSILSVPLGFVFFEEPMSFSVRTAKFIKDD